MGCPRAIVLILAASASLCAADVCNPDALHGPYGFQLSGTTTVAGPELPVASIGRLVLDGYGKIAGVSSVNFNGLFLGNPVTGTYEATFNCTVTWSLQDDSGAWQHFAGRMAPDTGRIEFHQVDPWATIHGVLEPSADSCDQSTFGGHYHFVLGSLAAEADADAKGNLVLNHSSVTTSGSYQIDSDCFVEMQIALPDPETALAKFRGILVNKGDEILAVQTDPDHVADARFTRN